VEVVSSLEQALALLAGSDEVMIIGGGQLYAEALPLAHRLYLTHIELAVEGDTHFPDYTRFSWREIETESHCADEHNPYDYRFVTLERDDL
jgi:dihydrofolate reductase